MQYSRDSWEGADVKIAPKFMTKRYRENIQKLSYEKRIFI
jgi:hypothetical protein